MNYYLPYLKESEVEDLLKPEDYVPLKNNNGYGRVFSSTGFYPRFHLHVRFHEAEDFIIFMLHYDRLSHEQGESAEYMTVRVKRELGKLKQVLLRRIVYRASQRGIKKYGTVNIYRPPSFSNETPT